VGELALIADLPRSATVTAVRDSELFKISSTDFRRIVIAHPEVIFRMCNDLARRGAFRAADDETSSAARTVAILPAGADKVGLRGFVTDFTKALRPFGSVARVDSSAIAEWNGSLVAKLHRLEVDNRFVLYVGDEDASEWSKRCVRQADLVLLVGHGDGRPDLAGAEQALRDDVQTELVLLWDRLPHQTERWLAPRDVSAHHHVCDAAGMRRLARRVAGASVGVVLGGGGAAGFAHLGVLRALEEADIPIDMIGGTSSGAIMAALYAMGWDHEGRVARALRGFVETKMLIGPTLPVVAFSSSKKVTRNMQKTMGDVRIEDLTTPLFCISANLATGEPVVHSTGPVWRAIRSSASIPGIMPPVWHDGDLLVDGGVVSNLPVGMMRERITGKVIAIDVRPRPYKKTYRRFEPDVSGFRALGRKLNPLMPKVDSPGPLKTIMRAKELGGRRAELAELDARPPDLLLKIESEGIDMLDFRQGAKLIDIGYKAALTQLSSVSL